jgi:transcription elongation factor S-II
MVAFKCFAFVYTASHVVLNRAVRIEETVLNQFSGSEDKGYRDKLRSLILNLKDRKNPGLRCSIVKGDLAVETFCTMSKEVIAGCVLER